jgi:hypothetical protein
LSTHWKSFCLFFMTIYFPPSPLKVKWINNGSDRYQSKLWGNLWRGRTKTRRLCLFVSTCFRWYPEVNSLVARGKLASFCDISVKSMEIPWERRANTLWIVMDVTSQAIEVHDETRFSFYFCRFVGELF